VAQETRFEFGRNWASFLRHLTDARIATATASLVRLLGRDTLVGLSFLDVGSGSGLFSLAAHRLGARVTSFDYDPHSVACTQELRRRFGAGAVEWRVERGSALDPAYLAGLGRFDVVYSWGVLHHTGDLWRALELAIERVAPGGMLAVAIYNYQPLLTPAWSRIKRAYVASPAPVRMLMTGAGLAGFGLARAAGWVIRRGAAGKAARRRGMRFYQDVVDWIGGWPFQAARPEEVFRFCRDRGFALRELTTVGGRQGCNELVFVRIPSP